MADNMQFPIPNAVLEPYIRAAVATAITAALGSGEELVRKAVNTALTTKVNASGVVGSSSYDNSYMLAEIVSTNSIQKIARETIIEMAEGMRPQIKAEIEKQLRTKSGALAKTMVDGLLESLKTTWNISVKVEPIKER